MKTSRTPRDYVNIKVPKELADLVDHHVEERKLGYRSRGEFCIVAIRRLLEHYESTDRWKIRKGTIEP